MKLTHQKLYSAFFRELKTFYTINDLMVLLKSNDTKSITHDHADYVYSKLLEQNVIRSCTKKQFDLNELNEEEIAEREENDATILNDNTKGFYFKFVGVVYIDDCVLKIYPKYINLNHDYDSSPDDFEKASEKDKAEVEEHFKQVLRVIKKISNKSQSLGLNSLTKDNYNHVGMQIFLLEDYYKNGLYENLETIIETNGEGEIDWDKTINETTALIKNKKPYYVELQTINTRSNDFDYFKLLHESILCECSKSLKGIGLLDYLGMIPCELTGMELSSFGDVKYVTYRLQQEIRTQFVTKKRNQLISLLTYISEEKGYQRANTLKLFGSYHFEHVWEVVCKAVFNDLFDNKYRFGNTKLGSSPRIQLMINEGILREEVNLEEKYYDFTFKDLLEKVEWEITENTQQGVNVYYPIGNLTPDIICIDEKDSFFILDAKYYILKTNKNNKTIENNPGIQDVIKQFVYERAYNEFLRDFKFTHTINAFILPSLFLNWESEKNMISYHKGRVNYAFMQTTSYEKLGSIQILEIVPKFLFEKYLKSELCLIELTEYFHDKNLMHDINRRKLSDGQDIGLILVGHIRSEYFSQIYSKNRFLFYFYEKDKYQTFTVHPEIMNCSHFIGYDFDNKTGNIIKGTVVPVIKKMKGSELRKHLEEKGIQKQTEDMPSYYCITIENAECISYTEEQFEKLKKDIDDGRGNFLLDDYAPKVIGH